MKTQNQPIRRAVATMLLRNLFPLFLYGTAADPALYIDGRLRTVGEAIEGARVMVERDGLIVQVITDDVAQLNMRLELQRIYVLSFERIGCITKQLLFDTHVPFEMLEQAPFTFPFKVTLEARSPGSTLRYAGPVGFIRFYTAKGDFDYDRDYTMLRDEPLAEDPHDAPPVTASASIEHQEKGNGEKEAGTASPVAALEQAAPVLITAAATSAKSATSIPAHALPAEAPRLGVAPSPVKTTSLPRHAKTITMNDKATAPVVVAKKATASPVHHSAPTILPSDGRSTRLLIEKLRITTIVRVTAAGRTTEYRRVASRYGSTYYFMNGISCSIQTYAQGSCER